MLFCRNSLYLTYMDCMPLSMGGPIVQGELGSIVLNPMSVSLSVAYRSFTGERIPVILEIVQAATVNHDP